MSAEVKQMIAACETCRKYETNNTKETLMSHEITDRPWEKIGVDIFEVDKKEYLITVDYFSNFWEVDRLTTSTSAAVILKLKYHFARYGSPDGLVSDGGPQFASSEFHKFAKQWDFEHFITSPRHSNANGKVESAVKTAKKLIRKAIDSKADPYLAILDYRNTPTEGLDTSPVQRLMKRRTRTLLPTAGSLLQQTESTTHQDIKGFIGRQRRQQKYYNQHARDLPPLKQGDVVRMKPFRQGDKTWKKAIINQRLDERSYTLETDDGDTYRRNRVDLKKTAEPPTQADMPIPEEQPSLITAATHVPQDQTVPQAAAEPALTPAPVQPVPRPQRARRPPAYLADYVTT